MSVTMKSKSHRSNIGHSGNGAFCEPFPFMRPTLPELGQVIAEYQSAYRNGVLTNADLVARLESAVAQRVRGKHCGCVLSFTSGVMLVLRALGLQRRVIFPRFTFFSSGHRRLL